MNNRTAVQEYGRIAMAYFPKRREVMIRALEQEDKKELLNQRAFFQGLARRNVHNPEISKLALETADMIMDKVADKAELKSKGIWDNAVNGSGENHG